MIGPNAPIYVPKVAQPVEVHLSDYEVELTIVIGKTAKNVSEADALDYVLGYTGANDVRYLALAAASVRDVFYLFIFMLNGFSLGNLGVLPQAPADYVAVGLFQGIRLARSLWLTHALTHFHRQHHPPRTLPRFQQRHP